MVRGQNTPYGNFRQDQHTREQGGSSSGHDIVTTLRSEGFDQTMRRAMSFACLTIALLVLFSNRRYYSDDAYITLRYVQNFLDGNGIVWNAGEYVQGYTNFLFLVSISVLGFLGIDLQLASRLLSFAAYVVLVGAVAFSPTWLARAAKGRLGDAHPLKYLPVLFVSTSAPIIVWSMGGLETVFYCMLCTLGALFFIHGYAAKPDHDRSGGNLWVSGLFFSLAALTRLDALLLLGLSGLFILTLGKERIATRVITFGAPCLFILMAYFSWVYFYYGDLLPNTFYAKATDFSVRKLWNGVMYVGWYSRTTPFLLPLCAITGLLYLLRGRRLDFRISYLATLATAYMIYVVSVGGDHMYSYRLLVPVIPLASILLFLLLEKLVDPGQRILIATIYAAASVLCLLQLLHGSPLNPRTEDGASYVGTRVGRYIANEWPSDSLIALNTAGSTPYYATKNTYIDMLGLNDRHIARRKIGKNQMLSGWQRVPGHSKGDGAYVLSREPDYIIAGPAHGDTIDSPWFLSELEMQRDPRFKANYEIREVELDEREFRIKNDGRRQFRYYRRK